MTEKQKGVNGAPARDRDFYIKMAEHPRSRVIMANTTDTFMLADITRQADIIVGRFRDSILRTITIDEFSSDMDEYYNKVFGLEDLLEKMGQKVGVKYRKSRTYKEHLENNETTVDTQAQPTP